MPGKEDLKRVLDEASRKMQRKSSEIVRMALRSFLQGAPGPEGAVGRFRRHIVAVLATALVPAGACSSPTPEERIRARIESAEKAAEAKSLRTLGGCLSDSYADARGNDQRAMMGLLARHLLREPAIHILTHVASVTLDGAGRADADVFVALAYRPIDAAADLAGVQAELWRVKIELIEESPGDWRVSSADWRSVGLEDFLRWSAS
jgi:hypothetical protein